MRKVFYYLTMIILLLKIVGCTTIPVERGSVWVNQERYILTAHSREFARSVHVDGDDVYIGGMARERIGGVWTSSATLWKNGQKQTLSITLPDGGGTYVIGSMFLRAHGSAINSVYVHNGFVYAVGGISGIGSTESAILWINNRGTILDTRGTRGAAHDVVVRGNNIYVVGNLNNRAVVWVNGVPELLNNNNSEAVSIFIKDDDIYIAGIINSTAGGTQAVLWKNGVMQQLSHSGFSASRTTGVFVHENNVYVSGFVVNPDSSHRAVLYVNGVLQLLSENASRAEAVFVSNNNVYVAVNDDIRGGIPVVWIDGEIQIIPNEFSAQINDIFIDGHDIYAVGSSFLYLRDARQWNSRF
jgi:hypothetical protein